MTKGHRPLRFARLEEAVAEAERLVGAERAGRLAKRGSWTLGQTLGHLAAWNNFAYEGYPKEVTPPLPIRLILRLRKGATLRNGMKPGVHIPGVPTGTVGTEVMPTEEGLSRFKESVARIRAGGPRFPSPAFGLLTQGEQEQLALRHAELHLGFQDVV